MMNATVYHVRNWHDLRPMLTALFEAKQAADDLMKAFTVPTKTTKSPVPVTPKPTKKVAKTPAYSNHYTRKAKVAIVAKQHEVRETLVASVVTTPTQPVPSDTTDWCAFPLYPNKNPMTNRALGSTGVVQDRNPEPIHVDQQKGATIESVRAGLAALSKKAHEKQQVAVVGEKPTQAAYSFDKWQPISNSKDTVDPKAGINSGYSASSSKTRNKRQ